MYTTSSIKDKVLYFKEISSNLKYLNVNKAYYYQDKKALRDYLIKYFVPLLYQLRISSYI
jgi:hypothetical protein